MEQYAIQQNLAQRLLPQSELNERLESIAQQPVQLNLDPFAKKLDEAVNDFERAYLITALKEAWGNVTKAAEIAGVNKKTIERKVGELNLADELQSIRKELPNPRYERAKEMEAKIKATLLQYADLYKLPENEKSDLLYNRVPAVARELAEKTRLKPLKEARQEFESKLVSQVLKYVPADKAAEYLGVSERTVARKAPYRN